MAIALLLGGCVSSEPVVLSSQLDRPSAPAWSKGRKADGGGAVVCKVRVGEVRDLRADSQVLGAVGGRAIHADTPVWVRESLGVLSLDSSIQLISAGAQPDVEISVDVLKAYIYNINSAKAATVVVRVRYSREAVIFAEQNYRGGYDAVNWAYGDGETQGALNRALGRAVDALHADLTKHCDAVRTQGTTTHK